MPDLPPSGSWRGYYLYGRDDLKHPMRMRLTFTPEGSIQGDGVDDIFCFTIDGSFNASTSRVAWTKRYIGMHRVEYGGIYSGRVICGDWNIGPVTGGFWLWPDSIEESRKETAEDEVGEPLTLVAA